jgi:hypothetical protein
MEEASHQTLTVGGIAHGKNLAFSVLSRNNESKEYLRTLIAPNTLMGLEKS